MPFRDSVDKLVTVYFAGITAEKFEYKGERYVPKSIYVSPLIFRGYTCPSGCGGCCPRFSLDYLPNDPSPLKLVERKVEISGQIVSVRSDIQSDLSDHYCRHLDTKSGRCNIYSHRPFTCDFELIRFLHYKERVVITQKLFGRGWAMRRIDGERGAKCEMIETDNYWHSEVRRKLDHLATWADHFGLKTRISTITDWIDSGPHDIPLLLKS